MLIELTILIIFWLNIFLKGLFAVLASQVNDLQVLEVRTVPPNCPNSPRIFLRIIFTDLPLCPHKLGSEKAEKSITDGHPPQPQYALVRYHSRLLRPRVELIPLSQDVGFGTKIASMATASLDNRP